MKAATILRVLTLLIWANVLRAQVEEQNPYTSEADAEAGRKAYLRRCVHCHGVRGEGGRGVNLTTGQYRLGGSDSQLYLTLRNGIQDSEMPAFRMKPPDLWRLVTYLRRLAAAGVVESEKVRGDADAGRVVYQKLGCAQCHIVQGQGGDLGPDLSPIGRRRSLAYLRESIVAPGSDVPLRYRMVTVAPLRGAPVRGIHLNEDDYSIQLRDLAGDPRSFLKEDLRTFNYDRGSVMPPYDSLPRRDLDDLVTYLKSLR